MRFPHKVLLSLAVVAVCGSSVLAPPIHVVNLRGQLAVAPIPEPLPLPCEKQDWTNADRGCLSWTAPRDKKRQTTVAPRQFDGYASVGVVRLPAISGPYTIT